MLGLGAKLTSLKTLFKKLFLEKFKFTLGSELVTNGTFETDSGWTKGTGATIGSGVATITVTGGGYTYIKQNLTYVAGEKYKLTATVNGTADKEIRFLDHQSNQGGLLNAATTTVLTGSPQNISFTWIANSNSNAIEVDRQSGGDYSFTVDNVSVKKAIKQAPVAAFSLRKLGDVSPYACRIRRSSDNTEAQVMFDASDRVSESSVVRNTSQNLLAYSEDFGQWILNGDSRAKAVEDGFQCWKVTSGSGISGVYYNVSLTASKSYTFSAYVKQDTSDYAILRFGSPTSKQAKFTFSTEQFSEIDSGVLAHYAVKEGNWYRLAITLVSQPSTASTGIALYPDANKSIFIRSAQLEETVTYESTGTEKITNGDFSNGSTGWTVTPEGWTHSNGAMNWDYTSNGQNITQSISIEAGKKYQITFDISNASTFARLWIGNNSENYIVNNNSYKNYTNGSHTEELRVDSNQTELKIFAHIDGSSFSIDNVSVLEFDAIPSEYISTPVISNDGLTFTESTLDTFVGGENLLSYSEAFDSWENSAVATANTHPNPIDGATTADTVGSNGGVKHRTISATVPTTGTYIYSIYLKRKTGTGVIRIGDFTDGTNTVAVTNEWQRFSRATTLTAGSHTITLRIDTTDDEVYAWGAQLNTDSLKTYQATTGTARDGNASVVVLYNQTGGEDIIQDTQARQPLLYKGGLLVKANSLPSLKFDGSDDSLRFSDDDFSDTLNLNSLSTFLVLKHDVSDASGWALALGTNTGNKRWYMPNFASGGFEFRYGSNNALTASGNVNVNLVSGVAGLNSAKFKAYLNGSEVGEQDVQTNSGATDIAFIGTLVQGTGHFNGKISELVIFDSEQNINREAIESDIAKAHNITLS